MLLPLGRSQYIEFLRFLLILVSVSVLSLLLYQKLLPKGLFRMINIKSVSILE